MNHQESLAAYVLCCSIWRRDPTDTELAGWVLAFEDADPVVINETIKLVVKEDRPFMPRPGEILNEARRLSGDVPPTVAEALGAYQMGDLSNPLVAEAASGAYWDVNGEKGESEVHRFRAAYAALLRRAEDDKLRPARDAIEAGDGGDIMRLLGMDSDTGELEAGDDD